MALQIAGFFKFDWIGSVVFVTADSKSAFLSLEPAALIPNIDIRLATHLALHARSVR
jgi:hypothetical protein